MSVSKVGIVCLKWFLYDILRLINYLKAKKVIILSNELVKYDPELNTIPLRKFSAVEMNLFFSIISRMRDKGDQTVRLTFEQLKELSNYKPTANKRFEDDIQSTYQKLMSLHFSKYRTTGHAYFSKEMFNELLDIPKSYNKSSSNIDKFIIKPIKEELTPLFKGFSVHKKYGKGRGKPVIGYSFSWKPEAKDSNDFSRGKSADETSKLLNIQHNADLTNKEKWTSTYKFKGLPLGTTEREELRKAQAEHDKKIREEERKKLLAELRETFK